MNKQRLLLLAEALETRIPAKKFDLATWRDDSRAASNGTTDNDLLHTCGTTACAVGWACALPEFQKEGLRYGTAGPTLEGLVTEPGKEWRDSWTAVETFFGLSEDDAAWLFIDDNYHDEGQAMPGLPKKSDHSDYADIKPRHVADRIRHLLAGLGRESHSFIGFAA